MIKKLIDKILGGRSDNNISFSELCHLLIRLGFIQRKKGSHNIFRKDGIDEKPNLQSDGNKAKPYQVRQIRNMIIKYQLEDDYE
ncbi:MAG: type II toxin-antitoxin system HicA family toxin [Ignavibacteriae bacterium]|nr:type II toxin-antitoxin system HicA family toxin [Ignavibacteriota bacterium]